MTTILGIVYIILKEHLNGCNDSTTSVHEDGKVDKPTTTMKRKKKPN